MTSRAKGHRRVKSLAKELEDKLGDGDQRAALARASSSSLNSTHSNQSMLTDGRRLSTSSNGGISRPTSANGMRAVSSPEMPVASTSQLTPDSTGTPDDEERDEFLPLTPVAASPYNVTFPGSSQPDTPQSASFAQSNGHMTAAERREHSRRHSRVHSRNLSVFFPRPGEQQPWSAQELGNELHPPPGVDIPSAAPSPFGSWNGPDSGATSPLKTSQRRGHHHRHSVSHKCVPSPKPDMYTSEREHSFFTFRDPDDLSPTTPLSSSQRPASPTNYYRAQAENLPANSSVGLRAKYSHLPWPVRLFLVLALHLPLRTQIYLLLGVLEVALGAALWIYGQSGESLSVTGLGYLVVFDGIAAVCAIVVEGNAPGVEVLWDVMHGRSERGLRYPYGTYRHVTLAHFAQCVYLLFSAVYVCKESVEHVLLLHGPTEDFATDAHGLAHGGMGHGEQLGVGATSHAAAQFGDIGIVVPTGTLTLAVLTCFIASVAVQNHATLVEAVGASTYALRPQAPISAQSSRAVRITSLLSNPFSLATIIFGTALIVASLSIPGIQLAPLDKVVALLESIAMFYIAYPAAEATGKVLLQTAPPAEASTMAALTRAIDSLRDHPLVSAIDPPHVWQLTPHPPTSTAAAAFNKSATSLRDRAEAEAAASIVVATMLIRTRHEATDEDVLKVTQLARERCAPSLGGGGELTVQVVRDDRGHAHHQSHSHPHSHSHSHSHAHSH